MVWGIFKKKAKVAARNVAKFEKKDLMEATVGIAILVMYADGESKDSERDKTQKILNNTPALANYGPEVQATFQRYDTLCKEVGFMAAKVQIMREIKDCQGDQREMEDVLVTGLTVALSDGGMDEKEEKILKEVANTFGLRIENFIE
jgi:tellurite resistance protein TerB